jgi:hypothetical protein
VTVDRELALWQQQWQVDATTPQDLTAAIERQTRNMRVLLVVQIAITLIFGAGSILWALISAQEGAEVLTMAIWLFLTMGWTFSLANRRGTWKPTASTTAAFLDLAIARCRRRLRAIAFASVFYMVVLSFNLAWTWIYREGPRHDAPALWTFLTSAPNLAVWIFTVCLGVLAAGYRRRIQTELNNLVTVRRQLDEPERNS